jgi:hypothetical protein
MVMLTMSQIATMVNMTVFRRARCYLETTQGANQGAPGTGTSPGSGIRRGEKGDCTGSPPAKFRSLTLNQRVPRFESLCAHQ